VPTDQLAGSDAPLLEVVREGSSIPTRLFSAIALLAVANGALINMIMASRLLYGMAKEQVILEALGRVHEQRRTPWVAIIFTTAIAMVLIAVGKLDSLATVTVMLLLLVFALVNVAVLALRRERVEHRHFETPRLFPVLGLLISAALFAKQIADWNRNRLRHLRSAARGRSSALDRGTLLRRLGPSDQLARPRTNSRIAP
jgi:amino acid transporter